MLLELAELRAGYGDAVVLDDLSLALPEDGSLAVLGRNGVGKSTLILTILGFTRLHRGRIVWKGEDISRLPPHRRVQLGIGWVAQEREIFPSLTVAENLLVAARPGDWNLNKVFELFPRLRVVVHVRLRPCASRCGAFWGALGAQGNVITTMKRRW